MAELSSNHDGRLIYARRVIGELWSEAVLGTGLNIHEGLIAARTYAAQHNRPWPPNPRQRQASVDERRRMVRRAFRLLEPREKP